jgi:2-polyprenyl-3-methyl-5-hydroxy-6-metoxy-1,4-benzoquinol methylase
MNCRICHSDQLTRFLDLGFTPPADDFLRPDRLEEPEVYYPLEVMICDDCRLVQLSYVVPPELLFQREYPYESSTTETGRKHYYSMATELGTRYNLSAKDLVIDIGSNVGVLLAGFKARGARVLGIEPAKDVCTTANKNGIETINEFFSEPVAQTIVRTKGKAKVITGTNVIAHINDLHALVRGLDALLQQNGVFVFEAPYLLHLLEKLEYDTIYHEHLSYLCLTPIKRLVEQYGMEIIDAQEVSIHGGTMRYHIARKSDFSVTPAVGQYLALEREKGILELDYLKKFARSVENHRTELGWLLRNLKKDGKRIAGVSAPAKGMTLLNYCRIGPDTLDFITEKAPLKVGKFTPGMHIPVVADSELLEKMPDYALLLAWNFAEEIMKNLDGYRLKGGKFIIPIPSPRIVG